MTEAQTNDGLSRGRGTTVKTTRAWLAEMAGVSLIAAALLGAGGIAGCAKRQSTMDKPAEMQPQGDEIDARLRQLAELTENLAAASEQLPGRSDDEHVRLMGEVFDNLSKSLPLLYTGDPSGMFRQTVMTLSSSRDALTSRGADTDAQPTIDQGLRAAVDGVEALAALPTYSGASATASVTAARAKLGELDTTRGPIHHLVAAQIVGQVNRIVGNLSNELTRRATEEPETIDTGGQPTTEPTTTEPPATEPPATEPPATDPPTTEPPATEPPATEPPATEPPATEPPATDPPATEPPATEPPATEPPATEPPATELPGTEPPATEPPATEPPATDPPATEEMPAEEPPATEPPTTEEPPATDPPATEEPATEAPAIEEPAATDPPATEEPAGETPPADTPATEAPAGETPATETPAPETPAAETPAADPPTTEDPAAETPVGEGAPAQDPPAAGETGEGADDPIGEPPPNQESTGGDANK